MTEALLGLYLGLGLNQCSDLLPNKMKKLINDNKIIQHIIGFIIILVIMNITYHNMNYINLVTCSLFIYIMFIFSTKMDLRFTIVIITILSLLMINNKIKNNFLVYGLGSLFLIGVFLYYNKKIVQYGGNFNIGDFIIN